MCKKEKGNNYYFEKKLDYFFYIQKQIAFRHRKMSNCSNNKSYFNPSLQFETSKKRISCFWLAIFRVFISVFIGFDNQQALLFLSLFFSYLL